MSNPTEATAEPAPLIRKCAIETVLGPTIHALLKTTPENKQVRAQCLNLLHQQIPPELVEYEKIKDWIEFNITPKTGAPKSRAEAFSVNVERRYVETGTASYRQPYIGSGRIAVTEAQLFGEIEEAVVSGESFDTMVERIYDQIRSKADEDIECDGGDIQYDNHDSDDTEDHETNIEGNVSDLIRIWMENNDSDRLEELDGN